MTLIEQTQNDVFCAAVPEDIDPADESKRAALLAQLDVMAKQWVWHQWAGSTPPKDVTFAASQWLITKHVWQVDEFQPAHDCEECRAGNEKAKEFLRSNPGRWVAMANLTYTELWDVLP